MATTVLEVGFGSGLMYATRTDLASPLVPTPRRLGVMQDIAITFTGDPKELFGQFQYPVDVARGKTKIAGKAKFAQIQANMWNDFFFGQTIATGQQLTAFNEQGTVPSGTPFVITTTHTSTPLIDLGVFYSTTGTQLTYVTSAPLTGQYQFNTSNGTYTFSSTDTSIAMLLNYQYNASTTGYTLTVDNLLMGTTPRFQGVFNQQYNSMQIVMVFYNCTGTNITFPTRIDDYTIMDMDFMMSANAGGHVGIITTTQ